MTTFNTGNPIGSTDARDRLDNSENMDILENSTTLNAHPDRLGVMRKTRKGMELEHDNQIAAHEAEHDAQISAHESEHDAQISAHEVEHDNQMQSFEDDFDSRLAGMAFTRVGTFTTGATLTDMRQTLLWEASQGGDGHEYAWAGEFPKVVPAGSTPATSGGVGAGGWIDRSDVSLITPSVTEALRRSYADAGYNLVDGSFEAGGTLVNTNDVLLHEASGEAFSGNAGNVSAGTDPTLPSSGYVSRKDATLRLDLASESGSKLVGYKPTGTGAVATTVQSKLRGMVSVKDFGAIGDGVTDDTTAIALARQYIADTGNPVIVEPGIYLTAPFTMEILPYARQGFFIGSDSKRCVFKRVGTGSSPFIQLGSPEQTSFQANFPMRFIGIDGGEKTNGPAFTGYDLVRAKIYGVSFTGGTVACRLLGGISVSFYGATFEAANRGLEVLHYVTTAGQVSPSGGGWPNLIKVYGGEIVDNSEWGVFFNGGRMLCLDGVDVEGNGTELNASQGGIYVGPDIGLEVSTTVTFSKGVVIKNCWFEANKGVADIVMDSGINTIEDCLFFSSAGNNQNDILINGGKYIVSRCSTAFAKTNNLLETSSVQIGNLIDMCEFFTAYYNPAKTTVMSGNIIAINGGSAIAGFGLARPIEMVGTVDGTGGISGTVTFPVAFKAGTMPKVFLQVQNNSGLATIDQPDLYNVSSTGFTYKKKAFNGTVITTANYSFDWRALGEAN